MRTLILDEADALLGQSTEIFHSPTRTIIGMVNDLGIGADLQTLLLKFEEVFEKVETFDKRLNIIEEKLKDFDAEKALVKIGQLVEVDASISDMTEFMGYGTWELFGRGRITLCSGTATDSNGKKLSFQVSEIGGAYQHKLTEAENGPHTHQLKLKTSIVGRKNIEFHPLFPEAGDNIMTTESSGLGEPHNNIQPYIVIQRWKRVG